MFDIYDGFLYNSETIKDLKLGELLSLALKYHSHSYGSDILLKNIIIELKGRLDDGLIIEILPYAGYILK